MEGRWMDELVNRWVENRQQSWMNAGRGFMKGCLEAEGTEGTEGGQGQWWGTTAMAGGAAQTLLSAWPQVWQQGGVHGLHE